MRRVCSWCQTVQVAGPPGAKTSHVLCDACAAIVHAQLDTAEAAAAEPPVIPDAERLIEETQRIRRTSAHA
jgi:hypothetical protein